MVLGIADDEEVLPCLRKTVAAVQTLCTTILRRHTEPEHAWPIAKQPILAGFEEFETPTLPLMRLEDIETFDLAVGK